MAKRIRLLSLALSAGAFVLALIALVAAIARGGSGGGKDVQYVVYLGTNDKDTNEFPYTEREALEMAENVLIRYFTGYTIQEAHGGWVDSGTIYSEYTLVIYLSDTSLSMVRAAAKELISVFNQSSVLIQQNSTKTEFYTGS